MKDTRFIFVEGIMGAGKSTTAWFITEQLRRRGITAGILEEGPTLEQPEHSLRVATAFPHPNAIWRDLTPEAFMETSLQKWQHFVQSVQQDRAVTTCVGLLFHGNMTDLFLMNVEPSVLHNYVDQVIAHLQALKPVLIYFYHSNISQALRWICDERGKAWEDYQINWKVGSPYGKQRSLHGFDGLVQLYKDYRAICDHIFTQLEIPKLAIRNEGDWTKYYEQILGFLEVPVE